MESRGARGLQEKSSIPDPIRFFKTWTTSASQGASHGFYRTEVSVNGCWYIFDITADQFGLPPVIVVDVIEDSLRYSPGLEAAVDAHVNDLQRELEKQRNVDASTLQPGVAHGTSQSSGSMSNISEGRI